MQGGTNLKLTFDLWALYMLFYENRVLIFTELGNVCPCKYSLDFKPLREHNYYVHAIINLRVMLNILSVSPSVPNRFVSEDTPSQIFVTQMPFPCVTVLTNIACE